MLRIIRSEIEGTMQHFIAAAQPILINTIHVLIIDSDLDASRLISAALVEEGFRVSHVHDGIEALSWMRDRRPDVVLVDASPGADGFDTCMRLRWRDPDLPIIFMTRPGCTEAILEGFEAGGNDYVTKPLSRGEVIERLQACF